MARDVRLIRSPVSVAGMVLTTISAVVFLVVFLADLFGLHQNPYLGILFFLVLPAIFLLGLVMIPLGAWIERRRRLAGKAAMEVRWPSLDLNDPVQRQRAVAIFALTMANVVVVSLAAYRGVEYMDSVEFCGQVCHRVMRPEFVAYQDGAHSRVTCVQCHIGSGASWFARSKVSGTRQVVAVAVGSYSRPIASPVQNLRPARDTCEQCHWPEKFHGDIVRRVAEYSDDEKNSESVTNLSVHVGGASERRGVATGIHWHIAQQVEYITTDRERQVIPYVKVTARDGSVREYVAAGVTPEQLASGERRRMDCMDCHNRPSHLLAATAEKAVNTMMAEGTIPRTLPFIHREAVKALKATYPSEDVAAREISKGLREFYRALASGQPDAEPAVDQAIRGVQEIYRRNVFPDMNVRFGTYPNNIGHTDSPGCFRCHDDNHTSNDGKKISQGLRNMPRHLVFVSVFVGWAAAVALSAASPAPPSPARQAGPPAAASPAAAPAQSPPAAAEYAGDDTCAFCHESQGKNIQSTLHGKALNVKTPAATGHTCETCHGPGKAHAEAGGDITKIKRLSQLSPREASETCLSCHNSGTHVNWKGSMHDSRNLSCITCHSIHNPKSERAQLKTVSVIETCATCHKTEVAKLQRSGHMPLREGKMDCTSCHNPHGSTNVRMLKVGNWVNETCVSCHAEKRGPFLWDHAPVREACNTCHDPHGSNNERMLVAKQPMLCQRCHIGTRHPSTIYDANQLAARSIRMIGRGCVNCHTQIHGSNSPSGHAFVR